MPRFEKGTRAVTKVTVGTTILSSTGRELDVIGITSYEMEQASRPKGKRRSKYPDTDFVILNTRQMGGLHFRATERVRVAS